MFIKRHSDRHLFSNAKKSAKKGASPMTEKTDRRKTRTKQLLQKALIELIEEKGIHAITVSDLSERAGINRGTFYLHYRDTADFLEQLKAEMFEGLTKELGKVNPLEVASYAEKGQAYPVSIRVLEFFERHGEFFRVILGPNGDITFPLQIREFMREKLFHEVYSRFSSDGAIPQDYLVAAITSANFGILMHWFETDRKLPPAEVAMIITRILSQGPLFQLKEKG
jgi:AcrR family transcriptional regulator